MIGREQTALDYDVDGAAAWRRQSDGPHLADIAFRRRSADAQDPIAAQKQVEITVSMSVVQPVMPGHVAEQRCLREQSYQKGSAVHDRVVGHVQIRMDILRKQEREAQGRACAKGKPASSEPANKNEKRQCRRHVFYVAPDAMTDDQAVFAFKDVASFAAGETGVDPAAFADTRRG